MFVADLTRGVDVLKIGKVKNEVAAPAVSRPTLNRPDPVWRWLCQVPVTRP